MNISDKSKMRKAATQELNERKAQILSTLPSMDHMIHGSLITRAIKCGKPNCRCVTGDGHKSLYLSSFYHGQTGMDYVPAAWEPWIREGMKNYEAIKELLLELTELNLELFRRRKKE
ncbi:MAG: hypothetical protein FD166_3763 [Bacteroidetes bacterium]|nr:MAG: hypothetical protein FD166_3763 [Bacteroidota bacterium]